MRGSVLAVLLVLGVVTGASAATHHVAIQSMSFSPAQLTIAPGDTVTWTLQSGFHSTTSNTGVWDSPNMSTPGETYSFTFPNSGTFPYHCRIHPMMNAVITVSSTKVGTSTAIESSANPTVSGQNGTLTATVMKTGSSSEQPSGTVTFTSDGAPLCSAVTLSGGTASCSTSPLTVGTHSITATFNGDANFEASTSSPLLQTVDKAATTTSLVSSVNPSAPGQSVTFTATPSVTSPGSGSPSGTVTFKDGSSDLCASVALTSGSATCTTSALTSGTHAITAVYSGESRFHGSTSPEVSQVVGSAPAIPTGFSATASGTTQVVLQWNAVDSATSYEVHRSALNAPFALRLTTPTNGAFDDAVSANTTYVYKVRAVGAGGTSDFSAADAATTIVYSDPSPTIVRAVHVTELRTGINAMRAAAGLGAATFTEVSVGTLIRAVHWTELRSALDPARSLLALPVLAYTNPTLAPGTTPIRAVHATELRAGTQ